MNAATSDEKRRDAETAWHREQSDQAIARGVAARMRWRSARIEASRCVCDGCWRRYQESGDLNG